MRFKHKFLFGHISNLPILLLFFTVGFGANTLPLLRTAENYFEQKNFNASITEYWRFIYFSDSHPYLFYAYYKAGLAEAKLNNFNEAEALFRRSLQLAPNENFKRRIQYQLILNLIYNGKYDIAKIELFKIKNNKNSVFYRDLANLYMGLIYFSEESFKKSLREFRQLKNSQIFNQAGKEALTKIINLLTVLSNSKQQKSPRVAKWLSTFLPGSGQIYAGEILNGFDALGLNIVTGFFLFKMIKLKKYRDASLVASLLWWRYYNGNRIRAEQAAMAANQRYKEKYIKRTFNLLQKLTLIPPKEKAIIEWRDLAKIKD